MLGLAWWPRHCLPSWHAGIRCPALVVTWWEEAWGGVVVTKIWGLGRGTSWSRATSRNIRVSPLDWEKQSSLPKTYHIGKWDGKNAPANPLPHPLLLFFLNPSKTHILSNKGTQHASFPKLVAARIGQLPGLPQHNHTPAIMLTSVQAVPTPYRLDYFLWILPSQVSLPWPWHDQSSSPRPG